MSSYKYYRLNSTSDIIDLAKEIQSLVYWNTSFFCENTQEYFKWIEFWSLVEDYIDTEEITAVQFTNGDEVTFLKEVPHGN